MKFTVLGSGSTGNAAIISSGKTNILVDAGLSARELMRRLALMGMEPEELDAILITHEHTDHVGGLRVLLQKVKCPVYISGHTEEACYESSWMGKNGENETSKRREAMRGRTVTIESCKEFRIGDIDIEPFSVPHDAVDNFGFVARTNGVKIATLTDFGHFTDLMREKLMGCDAIVIESNHNVDMLRLCPEYSWSLKQRIMGKHGHFSNEDLADWLSNGFDGSARHIILAHLSQRANNPAVARMSAETALKMRPPLFQAETKVSLTSHREPTDWFQF